MTNFCRAVGCIPNQSKPADDAAFVVSTSEFARKQQLLYFFGFVIVVVCSFFGTDLFLFVFDLLFLKTKYIL